MQTVLISRTYQTSPKQRYEVALLQDTDTLRLTWEVRVLVETTRKGTVVGSITRRKTRTDAMRLVRRALYGFAGTV